MRRLKTYKIVLKRLPLNVTRCPACKKRYCTVSDGIQEDKAIRSVYRAYTADCFGEPQAVLFCLVFFCTNFVKRSGCCDPRPPCPRPSDAICHSRRNDDGRPTFAHANLEELPVAFAFALSFSIKYAALGSGVLGTAYGLGDPEPQNG